MRKSLIISITFISAILAFAGKDKFIITKLSETELINKGHIEPLMNISFFASIIFPLLIAPIQIILLQKGLMNLKNQCLNKSNI
jgi:hypothetical protein